MLRILSILLAALFTSTIPAKSDSNYPSRPITMIVPYATGGTAEFFARVLAQNLAPILNQQIIVDPRPGAGGNLGSALVAKAEGDGYTLLLGTSGSNAINPTLFASLPYDARKDLTLVATVANTANVFVTSAENNFKSISDLVAFARKNPGKLTYASSGIGSVLHLSGAELDHLANIQSLHIPYKGTSPALIDVIAGRVDYMIANAPSVVSMVNAGKLRALAVTGKEPVDAFPGVPTVAQTIPNYDLTSWFAVFTPSSTPPSIIQKLNAEINKVLRKDSVKELFRTQGATPLIMETKRAEGFFLSELDKWGGLVKTSGAKVD